MAQSGLASDASSGRVFIVDHIKGDGLRARVGAGDISDFWRALPKVTPDMAISIREAVCDSTVPGRLVRSDRFERMNNLPIAAIDDASGARVNDTRHCFFSGVGRIRIATSVCLVAWSAAVNLGRSM